MKKLRKQFKGDIQSVLLLQGMLGIKTIEFEDPKILKFSKGTLVESQFGVDF